MFETEHIDAPTYLAAYALAPSGARIWYFPRADAPAPAVTVGEAPAVFAQGVAIGPEHTPGVYTVYAYLLSRPLTRVQLESPPKDAVVLHRTQMIEVHP
jgi:hypothetical protein